MTFHGPQPGSKNHNKGVQRMARELRRDEAAARNSKTIHNATKAHRLGRCGADHGSL